jgi:G3E family GTPase
MDAVLLTGPLGSGKTTLLSAWGAGTDVADTAVIVNEAGELGLDGLMVSSAAPSLPVRMLDNGCLCCSAGGDLAVAVEAVAAEHWNRRGRTLRRVVVEASGLAHPGPLLRQLRMARARIDRVRIVAVFDAVRGVQGGTAAPVAPAALSQWAASDVVVLTKLDLVASAFAEVRDAASRAAPLATVIESGGLQAALNAPIGPPRLAQSWGRAESHGVQRLLLKPAPTDPETLGEWLDNLTGLLGDRLLRLKGVVDLAGWARPAVVQTVGTLVSDLFPLAGETTVAPFLVLLGRELETVDLHSIDPRGVFPVHQEAQSAG